MSTCLEDLGWSPAFARVFDHIGEPDLVAGRIIEEEKGAFRVATADGELPATLGGRLRHLATAPDQLPAVGDWVAVRVETGLASIRHLLPRVSTLCRRAVGGRSAAQVVAANLDVAFFVAGIDHAFNPALAERALALVRESGALPVLVLNKADLAADPEGVAHAATAAVTGVPVHLTSGRDGSGLEALASYVGRGKTGALFGPSGVGKSTLVNRLAGNAIQATGEVRDWDRRGRHTTTSRQLLRIPSGGLLIDTPGIRELGLLGDSDGLASVFADIAALAAGCAFRDCSHTQEPACAVREAVEQGTIDERRLASQVKLAREIGRVERRLENRTRREEGRRARKRRHALLARAEQSE